MNTRKTLAAALAAVAMGSAGVAAAQTTLTITNTLAATRDAEFRPGAADRFRVEPAAVTLAPRAGATSVPSQRRKPNCRSSAFTARVRRSLTASVR